MVGLVRSSDLRPSEVFFSASTSVNLGFCVVPTRSLSVFMISSRFPLSTMRSSQAMEYERQKDVTNCHSLYEGIL